MSRFYSPKYKGICTSKIAVEDENNTTGHGLRKSAEGGCKQARKCVYECRGKRDDAVLLRCYFYHEITPTGEIIRDVNQGFILVDDDPRIPRQPVMNKLQSLEKELRELREIEEHLGEGGIMRLHELEKILGEGQSMGEQE